MSLEILVRHTVTELTLLNESDVLFYTKKKKNVHVHSET